MYQSEVQTSGPYTAFGWKPSPPEKTPFRDERVRQAYSMSLDRDLWIEALHNVSKFEAEGMSMETRWETRVGQEMVGWSLDPKDKDFGPNAKYFFHDIAEAKELLAAAATRMDCGSLRTGLPQAPPSTCPSGSKSSKAWPVKPAFGSSRTTSTSKLSIPSTVMAVVTGEGMSHANTSVTSPDAIERLAVNYRSSPGTQSSLGSTPTA